MTSSDDRRAAAILLAVAALGIGVRACGAGGAAPGEVRIVAGSRDRPAADTIAARAERLARPLGRFEKIDVDRAEAEELARLPRVGPALAARIVDDRERRGPFGSLESLDRVSGIGPALLDAVRRHVTFSGTPAAATVARSGRIPLNTATEEELMALPGIGPAKARAIVADRERLGPFRRLEDLTRVSGIGPGTLMRIAEMVRVP